MGKKKVNPTQEEVTAAYQEVLGRKPDPGGLETYMNSGLTGDALRKNLASSTEASIRAGKGKLDLNKYGVKTFELQKLDKGTQETFEKYKKKFNWGEGAITKNVFNEIKQMRYMFKTPEAEQEYWKKSVKIERGARGLEVQVTDKAISRLGQTDKWGNFDLSRSFAGTEGVAFLFPTMVGDTKVFMRGKRFSDQQELKIDGQATGYSYTNRIAAPKSGFFGEVFEFFDDTLGMGPDGAAIFTMGTGYMLGGPIGAAIASPKPIEELTGSKTGYFLGDPLGLWSGLTYGTEGYEKNLKATASTFNTSVEKVQRAQAIGQSVVVAAVSIVGTPLAGAIVQSGMSAVRNTNAAYLGHKSASKAFASFGLDTAMAAASYAGSSYIQGLELNTWADLGARVGFESVKTTLGSAGQSYIETGRAQWREAARAGAVAGLATGVGDFSPSVYGINLGSTAVHLGFSRSPEERAGIFASAITSGILGYMSKDPDLSSPWVQGRMIDPMRDAYRNNLKIVETEAGNLAQKFGQEYADQYVSEYKQHMDDIYYSKGIFGRNAVANLRPGLSNVVGFEALPSPVLESQLLTSGMPADVMSDSGVVYGTTDVLSDRFTYEALDDTGSMYTMTANRTGNEPPDLTMTAYANPEARGFFSVPGLEPGVYDPNTGTYRVSSDRSERQTVFYKDPRSGQDRINFANVWPALKQMFTGRPAPTYLPGVARAYDDSQGLDNFGRYLASGYYTPGDVRLSEVSVESTYQTALGPDGKPMPRYPFEGGGRVSNQYLYDLAYKYSDAIGLTAGASQ